MNKVFLEKVYLYHRKKESRMAQIPRNIYIFGNLYFHKNENNTFLYLP